MVGEGGAHGASMDRVGQDTSCQDQQVVESELPLPPPAFGGLDGTTAHDLHQAVEDLVVEPFDLGADAVADGPESVAHLVDGDAARPVLLVADLLPAGDDLAVSEDPDHRQGVTVGLLEPVGEQLDQVESVEHGVGFGGAVLA